MKSRLASLLGVFAMVALADRALAQSANCTPLPSGPVQVLLTPVAPAGDGPPGPFLVADPNLPPLFDKNLRIDIGFEYLQPYFSGRAVTLTVPTSPNGAGLVAESGNFSHNFAFVPRFDLNYDFPDLGFGAGASAKLIDLSGHLQRSINSTAGSAVLNVQSGVDIVSANLLEGTKEFVLGDWECFQDSCLADCAFVTTLGARYSHVRQDYTASLASGPNTGTLSATQSYNGFGLTSSIGNLCPLVGHFFLYGSARGSVLVGPNNRSTSVTIMAAGSAANSTGAIVTEDKTTFMGVGEFELGIAWSKSLPPAQPTTPGHTGLLLWFKVGWVGQIWGDLGLLSATDRPQNFSNSSLFLQGFSVLAGVDF